MLWHLINSLWLGRNWLFWDSKPLETEKGPSRNRSVRWKLNNPVRNSSVQSNISQETIFFHFNHPRTKYQTTRDHVCTLESPELLKLASPKLFTLPGFALLCVLCAQLCPILFDPMECSLAGSSVHGIFQARALESVAISFSRVSSQTRDRTRVSHIASRCFTVWATREAQTLIKALALALPLPLSSGSWWPSAPLWPFVVCHVSWV